MINYTWKISSVDCAPEEDGLQNVVKTIHWQLIGVDEETGESANVFNMLTAPEATSTSFIAFEDLTEAIVAGWVEETYANEFMLLPALETEEGYTVDTKSRLDHLKEEIETKINNIINPPIVNRILLG